MSLPVCHIIPAGLHLQIEEFHLSFTVFNSIFTGVYLNLGQGDLLTAVLKVVLVYFQLKSGYTGFLVILAVFVTDFEALLVIGETRSKQHQIRREKLARDWGDRLELANCNLRKKRKKL